MKPSFAKSVKTVLSAISIADRKILSALAQSPEQSATASELCRVLGLTSVVQVNGAMGRVGRKLFTVFGAHPDGLPEGEYQWWLMIATGEASADRGFVWTLRAEVVAGLLESGDALRSSTEVSVAAQRSPQFWTAHWQSSLWNPKANVEGHPIQASGSGVLETRGIAPGDVLYIISLSEGHLLLGGKMVVQHIVSREAACQMLGRDSLFETNQWAINMHGGSPLHLHRRLSPKLSKKLIFLRAGGERGLTFRDGSKLDNQATRGLSQLTRESARLLDSIIDVTDSMPQTVDMMTVTDELLPEPTSSVAKSTPLETVESMTLTVPIFEGLINIVSVAIRERSQQARDICLKKHGCNCAVCDVNFENLYGLIGKGFIHVHHLELLSNPIGEREVDPEADLIPVCPNCHAMIHRQTPPLSVNEMRTLLAMQRELKDQTPP